MNSEVGMRKSELPSYGRAQRAWSGGILECWSSGACYRSVCADMYIDVETSDVSFRCQVSGVSPAVGL